MLLEDFTESSSKDIPETAVLKRVKGLCYKKHSSPQAADNHLRNLHLETVSDGGDNKLRVNDPPGLLIDLVPGKARAVTVLLQNKCRPPNCQEHSMSYLVPKRE